MQIATLGSSEQINTSKLHTWKASLLHLYRAQHGHQHVELQHGHILKGSSQLQHAFGLVSGESSIHIHLQGMRRCCMRADQDPAK